MQNETISTSEKPQLRMSQESTTFSRPLNDWPPETEYEVPRLALETRKPPLILVALAVFGTAALVYFLLP